VTSRWIGAVEGYYGPPLSREARIELVRWMGSHGFNSYCYAPKDDPFHRQRWREPYPPAEREALAELVEEGRRAGVEVALAISPGLDYRAEDAGTLVTKLQSFRDLGARILAVAWDDVNPGGAELGELHGGAIAAAVDALDDGELRWVSCPTDYAASSATPYLRAFADALPDKVDILWTGPSIVTPDLSADMVRAFATELGRPPLFGENFPVNDGTMINVLHLGPYPPRDPEVVAATTGVWCNLMPRALASRPGLALATRFWNDPRGEREQAWAETIAEFPGLGPLARASRNWANDGEPDAELLRWAEAALDGDQR
jgi:hyaluronoglucosaminidase